MLLPYTTSEPIQILGSYISKYNRKYKSKKTAKLGQQYDIKNVAERLEAYQRYQRTMLREKKNKEKRIQDKKDKKVKKIITKALYTNISKEDKYKPVYNPYLKLYEKLSNAVDPKLIEKYRKGKGNVYSLHEFRYLPLPKSNNIITAGQAWYGLKKSWLGYKIATGNRYNEPDNENMKIYASTIQKWNYLLETANMPSFPEIGISKEGFNHAAILKKYFEGFENEVVI